MSLSIDGFWKSGFWTETFWSDGFWYEGDPVIPPSEESQPVTGGYEIWNPAYLVNRKRRELEKKQMPRVAKKAIQQVARLNLPINEAEIALRLRTQQIEWNNQYLQYVMELQDALQQSLAYESQQLNDRLRIGAYQAEMAREALLERNRRISIIMQLI